MGGPDRTCLIEVGCGTGEALLPLRNKFKHIVGIDFNENFIEFCNSKLDESATNTKFILGDACVTRELLAEHTPEWTSAPKLVVCVGNTIGIMPVEIKETIYHEMADTAGLDGFAVMVYWNGNKFGAHAFDCRHWHSPFCAQSLPHCAAVDVWPLPLTVPYAGDACQHFYHANPQLCGPFTGEAIDLDTCTLTCPSGYQTHWTKPEEARSIIEGFGLQVISIEESSDRVGVIAVFKNK